MISALFQRILAVVGVAATVLVAAPGIASAEPVSHLSRVEVKSDRVVVAHVYSAAMDRVVPLRVRTPADTSRAAPTLYLLNGAGGGQGVATWDEQTDIDEFFADKNVNVVLPIGGTASYYTDWRNPDPVLGVNKWETFLTQELPQLIDARFHGNGVNAVAGLSMGATGAMSLITRHPDLYRGVAALSGCFDTSRESSRDSVRGTVAYKGGNPDNMWGPPGDPVWEEHDSYLLAERLRGKEIFLSTGNGLVGPYDFGSGEEVLTGGTPLEVGTLACTVTFDRRLRQLDIPAQVVYRPWGTHSWAYWQDDIKTAWPTLKAALQL